MLPPRATLLFLISCALLFPSESTGQQTQPQPQPYRSVEAYKVYDAILPLGWPARTAHAKKLATRSVTAHYTNCLRVGDNQDKGVDSAVGNYLDLNQEPWLLEKNFHIDLPYELTSNDDLLTEQNSETGGVIDLSAVGFNADETVAVVYMGHNCGLLCGGGGFYVLLKKDGQWHPVKKPMVGCGWVS